MLNWSVYKISPNEFISYLLSSSFKLLHFFSDMEEGNFYCHLQRVNLMFFLLQMRTSNIRYF